MPRNESIVSPAIGLSRLRSPIRARDNIPVVSWLVLRGRCRDCQAPISARYPLVELRVRRSSPGRRPFWLQWDLPAFLVLFAGLLALSCIDVERMILPKKIVYPLTSWSRRSAVAAAETGKWHGYVVGAICAAAWFVVFFALNS